MALCVCVDSLLLFAFASLSARPSRTPASRSPGGTPPSSASRAGTPRSCHTCGGQDTHVITLFVRPLNSTFLSTSARKSSRHSLRTRSTVGGGKRGGGCRGKGKRHFNKTSLCHRYDYGACRIGPRECRRAARSGSQTAATVSTTSHVITFCLVRASSRRKVQLSPPAQTGRRRVR